MKTNDQTMVVLVDGKEEIRAIDYYQQTDFGPSKAVPVLKAGENTMHTLDGATHIYKTGVE